MCLFFHKTFGIEKHTYLFCYNHTYFCRMTSVGLGCSCACICCLLNMYHIFTLFACGPILLFGHTGGWGHSRWIQWFVLGGMESRNLFKLASAFLPGSRSSACQILVLGGNVLVLYAFLWHPYVINSFTHVVKVRFGKQILEDSLLVFLEDLENSCLAT